MDGTASGSVATRKGDLNNSRSTVAETGEKPDIGSQSSGSSNNRRRRGGEVIALDLFDAGKRTGDADVLGAASSRRGVYAPAMGRGIC